MPCSVARNRSICCATLKAFSRSLGCSLSVTDRRGWGEREKKNWVSDTMRLVLSSSPQTFIKTYACDTTKMINTWKKIHTQTSQSASSSPNSLSYIFCHMERWRQMELIHWWQVSSAGEINGGPDDEFKAAWPLDNDIMHVSLSNWVLLLTIRRNARFIKTGVPIRVKLFRILLCWLYTKHFLSWSCCCETRIKFCWFYLFFGPHFHFVQPVTPE